MATITFQAEGNYRDEFIKSVSHIGALSFEQGTLAAGQNLKPGTVLGRITTAAASTAPKPGGNTGNGAMGAVALGAPAQPGVYQLRITKAAANAGDFQVTDPQGDVVGLGSVGVPFAGGGLSFTLADGAADFIAGDGFDITVAAGSGKFTQLNPAAVDGSQNAAAILRDFVDATAGDVPCVVAARLLEAVDARLVWPAGITAAQKAAAKAQLLAAHIALR